jgi:hypothetical protein
MRITQFPGHRLTELRETYLPLIEAARRPAMFEHLKLPWPPRHRVSRAEILRARVSQWGSVVAGGARHTLAMTSSAARKVSRRPAAMLVVSGAAGALGMYYLDPYSGRRRRALVRDRLAHLRNVATHQVPHTVERKGRYVGGVARGLRHDAAEIAHLDGHHPVVDDETLVARVRSEALRQREIKAGEIHVDAYEGCVTLRGQLDHEDEIRHLIDVVRHVEGVREVRSYLHLPGTLPPNKAESYTRVPAEFARPF